MPSINFLFSISQPIRIIAISMLGQVIALMYDREGPMYHIIYWNNGERYTAWMYDWEIEAIEGDKNAQ